MAVRPEISLGFKVPEVQGPLDTYKQTLTLKALLDQRAISAQQQRMNEQTMQSNAEKMRGEKLTNDDLERAAEGKKAFSDALAKAVRVGDDGSFDIDDAAMAEGLKSHPEQMIVYQKMKGDIKKEAREDLKSDLETRSKVNKAAAAYFAPVLDASPQIQPDLYSAAIKRAKADKTVADRVKDMPDQFDPEVVPYITQMVQATVDDPWKAHLDAMTRKEQTDKAEAELPGVKAEAEGKQRKEEASKLGAAKSQEAWNAALATIPEERRKLYPVEWSEDARKKALVSGLDPKDLTTLEKYNTPAEMAAAAAKGDADAKKAMDILKDYEISLDEGKEKAKAKASGLGFEADADGPKGASPILPPGQKNDAFLATLPTALANHVRQLANGEATFPTSGLAMNSPYWKARIDAVMKYDPSFDQINYNQRAKLRQAFATPTGNNPAQQLVNINTAIEHTGRTLKNIDKLGNFEAPMPIMVNEFKNWAKMKLGYGGDIKRFQDDVNALVNESIKAWTNAGGTIPEIAAWKKNFDAADSPESLKASLQELGELLLGKVRPLHQTYLEGMHLNNADIEVLRPNSVRALESLGIPMPDDMAYLAKNKPAAPAAPAPGAPIGKVATKAIVDRMASTHKQYTRQQVMDQMKADGWTIAPGVE